MASQLARVLSGVRRRARRGAKHARQRLRRGPARASPVYVVGCQRSGTTLLMDVLDRSPETRVYQEYDRAAFRSWRLRSREQRALLLRNARCRCVVYKPLQDSQHVDRLLDEDRDARAVWVLRAYPDVVRSWVRKWGEALREPLRRLATEPEADHWLAERMPAERRRLVSELFREDLSLESGAALRWVLRNEIFFDRGLAERPGRVFSLWYEDMVDAPGETLGALFAFLGLDFDAALASEVEVGRKTGEPVPEIDPAVGALCLDLTRRLEAAAPRRAA